MKLLRRILTAAIVLALAVSGWLALDRLVLNPEGTEVTAMFESTVGLYPGSDVQMLGVPVGRVTAIEPKGDLVEVTMVLDPGQEAAADTRAVLVAPTVVSDRFIQLTEPYDEESGAAKFDSGGVIEAKDTAVPVEIDELYQSLDDVGTQLGPEGANRDGALSELLTVAAENLDGQGRNLNTMFEEFSKATATMNDTGEDFFSVIANLHTFTEMLAENDLTVAQVNRQFATVTGYLADDRDDMSAAIVNLADALAIVDDFIRDNRGNLTTSVKQLTGPTKVLKKQRRSMEEAVRLIPLALQNYLRAYNPATGTLDGRGNLNELTLWAKDGLSGSTSDDAPPVLIPGDDGGDEGGEGQ